MAKNVRFFVYYLGVNLSAAMEYRGAFLAQAIGMFANDAVNLGVGNDVNANNCHFVDPTKWK